MFVGCIKKRTRSLRHTPMELQQTPKRKASSSSDEPPAKKPKSNPKAEWIARMRSKIIAKHRARSATRAKDASRHSERHRLMAKYGACTPVEMYTPPGSDKEELFPWNPIKDIVHEVIGDIITDPMMIIDGYIDQTFAMPAWGACVSYNNRYVATQRSYCVQVVDMTLGNGCSSERDELSVTRMA